MKLEIEYDPTDKNPDWQWFMYIATDRQIDRGRHANITRSTALRLLSEFHFTQLDLGNHKTEGYRFKLLEKAPIERKKKSYSLNEMAV